MKMMHLVIGQPYGGMQRIAHELNNSLNEVGHFSVLQELKPVLRMPMERLFLYLKAYYFVLSGGRLVLHSPSILTSLLLFPVVRFCVVYIHSRPSIKAHGKNLKRFINDEICRKFMKFSAANIYVSIWVRKEWALSPISGYVVYNGININKTICKAISKSDRKRNKVIGVACRIEYLKGIEELIGIAEELRARDSEWVIHVAGTGSQLGLYEKLVRKKNLDFYIKFVGFVDDIHKFWIDKRVSIFTSRFESFGLRLVEPVFFKCHCIAYLNASGSDEIVDILKIDKFEFNDIKGVCDRLNEIDEMTNEELDLLAENRFICAIENFSFERMVNQFIEIANIR